MWIKKKKITELEKRIADLEEQVQSQQKVYSFEGIKLEGSCEDIKKLITEITKGQDSKDVFVPMSSDGICSGANSCNPPSNQKTRR